MRWNVVKVVRLLKSEKKIFYMFIKRHYKEDTHLLFFSFSGSPGQNKRIWSSEMGNNIKV